MAWLIASSLCVCVCGGGVGKGSSIILGAEWTLSFQAAAEEERAMDTPDSASRLFCSRILSMVNADDVNAIILAQKNM